jgi:hypothetical protein
LDHAEAARRPLLHSLPLPNLRLPGAYDDAITCKRPMVDTISRQEVHSSRWTCSHVAETGQLDVGHERGEARPVEQPRSQLVNELSLKTMARDGDAP